MYSNVLCVCVFQVSTSLSVRVEELDDTSSETDTNSSSNSNSKGNSNDKARIAWVEPKDVQSLYPALAEAIQNLHSLPFEINGVYETTVLVISAVLVTCVLLVCWLVN
jgi:hypothetical protein